MRHRCGRSERELERGVEKATDGFVLARDARGGPSDARWRRGDEIRHRGKPDP